MEPVWVDTGAHPFATGPWRAPANNTNTFARESQIEIMASKAGIDPLEFRIKNLKDERLIGVLRAVGINSDGPRSRGQAVVESAYPSAPM